MPDTLPNASDIHADAPVSPRDAFGFRLGRLSRWWRGQIDERLRPQGLTQARWIVLVNLRRGGEGMQQKDLARFVGVEGPTLVRVLDYLEGENLIERRADTSDRRAKSVHLTPHGYQCLQQIDRITADLRRQLLDGISDDDLQTCLKVFDRIRRNGNGERN